jgi:hypothetical protein
MKMVKKLENEGKSKGILGSIKISISKTAEEELVDEIASDDRSSSVAIIVVCVLFILLYIAHQTMSTGFFTEKFGALEMIMLYGPLIFWITTSSLILLGQKNPSRDLDSFGGLFFATFAISWNLVVFPFEFAYFADVLPDSLRFLLGWISNEVAWVILMLLIIVHLIFGVYSFILRVFVYKARASWSAKTYINGDNITKLV